MSKSKLAEIIDKNWFQDLSDGKIRVWSFEEDLFTSNENASAELTELIQKYKLGQKKKSLTQTYLNESESSKSYLIKFLHCLTLCEYRFDALVLSRDTRDKGMDLYAKDIGLPTEEVISIYEWWHAGARKEIYK